MATQGTEKVLGGTPYKRYPDPSVKGTPNEYGLYPWSTFRAAIGYVDTDKEIAVYTGGLLDRPAASICEFLFFVSDIPAIATAISYSYTDHVSFPAPIVNYPGSVRILAPTPGGAAGIPAGQYGKVLSGYAGASKQVYCTGFSASGYFVPPNNVASTDYAVECLCNSPTVCSPVGSNNTNKPNRLAPISLILLDTDYTQEIYDAGNLYKSPDGYLFQIVGLFNYTYTPPQEQG